MNKKILYPLRILLGILIVLNMVMIYQLSDQTGPDSHEVSKGVTYHIADIVVDDFDQKTTEEKDQIVAELHPSIRKLAHMGEFGTLGALILALLLTWNGYEVLRYLISLGATLLYACLDELHQHWSDGRGPQLQDVALDFLGAFLCCSVLLLVFLKLQQRKGFQPMRIQTTQYQIPSGGACRHGG